MAYGSLAPYGFWSGVRKVERYAGVALKLHLPTIASPKRSIFEFVGSV
jgi:hypothetical protein